MYIIVFATKPNDLTFIRTYFYGVIFFCAFLNVFSLVKRINFRCLDDLSRVIKTKLYVSSVATGESALMEKLSTMRNSQLILM